MFWNEIRSIWRVKRNVDLSLLALSFIATFLSVIIHMGILCKYTDEADLAAKASTAVMFGGWIICTIMAVRCSMVFDELSTKSGQIRMMLTPSSVQEKFWSRVVYTFALVIVLCPLVADLACGVWLMFQSEEVRQATWQILIGTRTQLSNDVTMTPKLLLAGHMNWILIGCIYTFGATIFRKWSFLYTTLLTSALFVAFLLLIGFCIGFYMGFCGMEKMTNDQIEQMVLGFYFNGLLIGAPILSVLFLALGYNRFKKLQFKTR